MTEEWKTPPQHYQGKDGMQPWDIIRAYELDYWRGNVVKYILRAGRKEDTLADLEKAQNYLSYLIHQEKVREYETNDPEPPEPQGRDASECEHYCSCHRCSPGCVKESCAAVGYQRRAERLRQRRLRERAAPEPNPAPTGTEPLSELCRHPLCPCLGVCRITCPNSACSATARQRRRSR